LGVRIGHDHPNCPLIPLRIGPNVEVSRHFHLCGTEVPIVSLAILTEEPASVKVVKKYPNFWGVNMRQYYVK
jgi:hypothetical protein